MRILVFLSVLAIWSVSAMVIGQEANVIVSMPNGIAQSPFGDMSHEELRASMRKAQRESIRVQFEVYSEPETIELIAKFSRRLFLSLVDSGFTEDQALEIVKTIGLPTR